MGNLFELSKNNLERMQKSLAEDEDFKQEVKQLEEKFGELVNKEMRDRLHLAKAHLYGEKINENLEDAVRSLYEAGQITARTAELLHEDTDKLRYAMEVVGLLHEEYRHPGRPEQDQPGAGVDGELRPQEEGGARAHGGGPRRGRRADHVVEVFVLNRALISESTN